jgi:heterodisulfide reductase subunit C
MVDLRGNAMNLKTLAQRYNLQTCLDCDHCRTVCPVAWADSRFSPAALAQACLQEKPLAGAAAFTLWTCTGCRACLTVCGEPLPDLAAFVLEARQTARQDGLMPDFPYRGALQAVMRMTGAENLAQKRQTVLPKARQKPVEPGQSLLLLGMLPYVSDVVSPELGVYAQQSMLAGFAVLEALGFEVGILADEVDAGHDFLWTGERDRFRRHARLLSTQINASGCARVVTLSQTLSETLQHDFPAVGYPIEPPVISLVELIAKQGQRLSLRPARQKVYLHSESRRAEADVLQQNLKAAVAWIPQLDPVTPAAPRFEAGEPAAGENQHLAPGGRTPAQFESTVGVQGFAVCGGWAAALQNELLEKAAQSGAAVVITPGTTAALHLRCACRQGAWCRSAVEAVDVATFVARHLQKTTADAPAADAPAADAPAADAPAKGAHNTTEQA